MRDLHGGTALSWAPHMPVCPARGPAGLCGQSQVPAVGTGPGASSIEGAGSVGVEGTVRGCLARLVRGSFVGTLSKEERDDISKPNLGTVAWPGEGEGV